MRPSHFDFDRPRGAGPTEGANPTEGGSRPVRLHFFVYRIRGMECDPLEAVSTKTNNLR